jgi:hypothetical protein
MNAPHVSSFPGGDRVILVERGRGFAVATPWAIIASVMSDAERLSQKFNAMSVAELQVAFAKCHIYDQVERPLIKAFLETKLLHEISAAADKLRESSQEMAEDVKSLSTSSGRIEGLTWGLLVLTIVLAAFTGYQIFGPEKVLPPTVVVRYSAPIIYPQPLPPKSPQKQSRRRH